MPRQPTLAGIDVFDAAAIAKKATAILGWEVTPAIAAAAVRAEQERMISVLVNADDLLKAITERKPA